MTMCYAKCKALNVLRDLYKSQFWVKMIYFVFRCLKNEEVIPLYHRRILNAYEDKIAILNAGLTFVEVSISIALSIDAPRNR